MALSRKTLGLGYIIKWIERAFRVELDAALMPLGMSTPEYTALSVLRGGRELSSAQVARRTFVSAQAMHPTVTRLIERKLVSRRPDPAGGRAYLIRLTDKGSMTIEACDRASRRVEEALFGALSSGERKAVQRALGKCVEAKLRDRSSRTGRNAQWLSKKEKVKAV